MKLRAGLLVALVLLALAPSMPASAGRGFGVSPATVDFTDPPALRGQEYDTTVRVANRDDSPASVTLSPEGDVGAWLSVVPSAPLVVPAQGSKDVVVHLKVPQDAANGLHEARLRVRAAAPDVAGSGSGSAVAVELVPAVRILVSGDQVLDLALESIAVRNATAGRPLDVVARVANSGNVRASPHLALSVKDSKGLAVFEDFLDIGAREPRSGGDVALRTSKAVLAAGEHQVTARLVLDEQVFGERAVEFQAVPPLGASLAEGRVVSFGPDGAAFEGRALRIDARFANTGFAAIESARATVEVFAGGARVATVQSDALRIEPGLEEDLVALWTPDAPGAYTLKGFVAFDGIKSELPERTVDVAARASAGDDLPKDPARIPAAGAALLLAGAGLVSLVVRRR